MWIIGGGGGGGGGPKSMLAPLQNYCEGPGPPLPMPMVLMSGHNIYFP